jgi:hypothetical protein
MKLKEVESLRNNIPTVIQHCQLTLLQVVNGSDMGMAKDVLVN